MKMPTLRRVKIFISSLLGGKNEAQPTPRQAPLKAVERQVEHADALKPIPTKEFDRAFPGSPKAIPVPGTDALAGRASGRPRNHVAKGLEQ